MGERIDSVLTAVLSAYQHAMVTFPHGAADMIAVFLLAFFIVAIALISWQFYRTLSRRDFIKLNLHHYNLSDNMVRKKVVSALIYILENILIMPILILFWFALLAIIIFVIAEQPEIRTILLVSAALVTAIRILAYSVPVLSEDVAKLFPLIMLSVFLLSPSIIGFEHFIEQIQQIPLLFTSIIYFFFAVFSIEIVLRCLTTLGAVWCEED